LGFLVESSTTELPAVYVALSTDTSAATTTLETSACDGTCVENAIDFSLYILFSAIQQRHLNKVPQTQLQRLPQQTL